MMSNCAFWSASGELLAVHGDPGRDQDAPPPRASFVPWAAGLRLPPGRLVDLGPGFPVPQAPGPGWQILDPERFPPRRPRPCPTGAPVAVFAPVFDAPGPLPREYHHEKFTWRCWPTWVSTCRPEPDAGAEGWYAALDAQRHSRFVVRLVPHHGRLPGEGWRNMLAATLRGAGLRLVPLNARPSSQVLESLPSWDYRAEAGRGPESAAWDLQVLPSRRFLEELSGLADPWQATALVRWVRPGAPAPDHGLGLGPVEGVWAQLFGRLPVADARKVVQNVLATAPGGAASAAALFYDSVVVPGPEGRTLVRHVPQPGLPVSLLSTVFGRSWPEVERARRRVPETTRAVREAALEDLDQRLAEGRLIWSSEAQGLWEALYRRPRARALEAELAAYRSSDRWQKVLSGDPRCAETLLRRLDVTDAALCLRDAPDTRWRRFVTGRREAELAAEAVFCSDWEARGELSVARQIDAWRSWDALVAEFPLTERPGGN